MGCLLRHARQSVAAFTPMTTAPYSSYKAGTAMANVDDASASTRLDKPAGNGTMSEANGPRACTWRPHARQANGSIPILG